MGRPLLYPDRMLAQFPAQTFDRVAEVLGYGEDKATFVRSSVLRELERRESAGEKRRLSPVKTRRSAAKG